MRVSSTAVRAGTLLALSQCLWPSVIAGVNDDEPQATMARLPAHNATYEVRARGLQIAKLEATLKSPTPETYRYQQLSRVVGVARVFGDRQVEESSEGRWTRDIPSPTRYSYRREGKKNKTKQMDFDWSEKLLRYRVRDKGGKNELTAGTQDKLSYILALALDMQRKATTFSYQIADGGKVKRYEFERRKTVSMDTPLGTLDAVHLVRVRESDAERRSELWVAPRFGYFPVRIRHVEKDGEVIELHLKTWSNRRPKPTANPRNESD